MKYRARWGPFGFIVSPSKIVPFDNFSTSITLKTDNGKDTSGADATNVRGLELQPMSFTTKYMRALGVDPRERFEAWTAQVGSAYPLYIGDKRLGPEKMMLTSVSASELITNNKGDFLSVTLDITLQENSQTASANASANGAVASKAAATYEQTVAKKKAMNTTASKSDKALKKPLEGKAVAR